MNNLETYKNQADAVKAFKSWNYKKEPDIYAMDTTTLLENFMTWLFAESKSKDVSHVQTPYTEREMRMLRALNGAKQAVVRISDDIHGSPDECEDCEDCDDAFGNCSRHDDCPYIDDMTVDEIRDKIDSEIAAAANYIDSILKERAL